MAAQHTNQFTTNSPGLAFLAFGVTGLFGGVLQGASTLLCRLCCCLMGELVQVAIWASLEGGHAIAAHLLDFGRIVEWCQWLASVGPLLHCLLAR
jgi:hypothetical protein